MSLDRCPRKGTPHGPHGTRLYFAGMGAVVPTTCPGEQPPDLDDRCPWCGEENLLAAAGTRSYDFALEAHAAECKVYLAEQGEIR